jgi:asparagine synthase (glutamine-hydrolysing)
MTDWVQGALRPAVETYLSDERVRARGLFRPEFVRSLREGRDVASETRRRRLGERLWALLVLEVWLRRFVDARGRAP